MKTCDEVYVHHCFKTDVIQLTESFSIFEKTRVGTRCQVVVGRVKNSRLRSERLLSAIKSAKTSNALTLKVPWPVS